MPKRKQSSGCLRTFLIVGAVVFLWILAANWPKYLKLSGEGDQGAAIPGITATEIYEDFTTRGFKVMRGGQDGQKWTLMKQDGAVTYTLEVVGRSSSEITQVRGSVEAKPEADVAKEATEFLGQVASRPYPGVEPTVARKWVESNITKNTKGSLGAVQVEIIAEPKASKSLTIRAKR